MDGDLRLGRWRDSGDHRAEPAAVPVVIRRAALALLLVVRPVPPGQAVAERWELEINGPATIEHGELRLDDTTGRVVLQSADSLFLTLAKLTRTDTSITFTIPSMQRSFSGTITPAGMRGIMIDTDGSPSSWNAQRILPGANRWPVPPRLTVRQLESGSDVAEIVVPGAWRAILPDEGRLAAEYDTISRAAGLIPRQGSQLQSRSAQIQLGFDLLVRWSIRRSLEAIEATPAADARFTELFRGPRGLRLDLNDMALELARRYRPELQLDQALTPIWKLMPGTVIPSDSAGLRELGWRFWTRFSQDSTLARRLDSLDTDGFPGVMDTRALMRGYDVAAVWWTDAVRWLMSARWVDTPAGRRSPQQLVAAFWDVDSLALPEIVVAHFGSPEAFPSPSVRPILDRLIQPANAIAADWLAQADRGEVLEAWRRLDWGEPFRVVIDGHSRYLTSPAVEVRTHAGELLGLRDEILIDPGVPPLLAVATLIHEWQHLIQSNLRIRGAAAGVLENSDELRLLEDNPWLAEGSAEWATDLILAPCRTIAPVLLAVSQSRRLAIQGATSDDPHALGYRLVRAAAEHSGDPGVVRDRLTRLLHDLPGFAQLSGLAGRGSLPPLTLVRPVNAAVIPEVTFVFDGGAALDVHRRLRVSHPPLEH
jgi:hypothetical protein